MKKLFVSVPMKGRTLEEIKDSFSKMKIIAEAYMGEELEEVASYIIENPPIGVNEPIWYLAKSLEILATADVFIGLDDAWMFPECEIEKSVAKEYGIESYLIKGGYVIDNFDALCRKIEEEYMQRREACL